MMSNLVLSEREKIMFNGTCDYIDDALHNGARIKSKKVKIFIAQNFNASDLEVEIIFEKVKLYYAD
jgi:hypothetical protein